MAVFPAASVTTNVLVVVPTGNALPLGSPAVWVILDWLIGSIDTKNDNCVGLLLFASVHPAPPKIGPSVNIPDWLQSIDIPQSWPSEAWSAWEIQQLPDVVE